MTERVVCATDGEHGSSVLEYARLLSRGLGAELHVIELRAPQTRDFVVAGAKARAAAVADTPVAQLWDACRGASLLVIDETRVGLVLLQDPESLAPRSSLPAGCAVVVVPARAGR